MKIYNAGNRIANAYVYPISNGYVMIDTGYENSLAKVENKLLKMGIQPHEIRYVFLTHAHDDHAGFLKEMVDKYSHLKVITNGKSVPILAKGQNPFVGGCSSMFALIFCNVMKLFGKGNHLFPAIDESYSNRMIVVSDENKKEIGKIIGGRIIMTAGHTADSMSLKVGDCIFCGDASMNGLPSINKITIWVEDIKAFENSWDVMINEKPICIYPGHGKPFKTCMLERKKHCISKIKLHELKN